MTHATKAIYRWMLADFLRVSQGQEQLFTESDLEQSMDKIETLDFHEVCRGLFRSRLSLSVCLSIPHSVCQPVCFPVCLSDWPFICLTVYLFACLTVPLCA